MKKIYSSLKYQSYSYCFWLLKWLLKRMLEKLPIKKMFEYWFKAESIKAHTSTNLVKIIFWRSNDQKIIKQL